jgi:hypothetical protein
MPHCTPQLKGDDIVIVGMENGELVNEKKSPQTHIGLSNGSVTIMPGEESFLLRNVGKQTLEVLVIDVQK